MVANTSHPDILGFTQHYAGGNEKEESPYSGEYCLYSVPGMVAKLRSTEREKHSQNIYVQWQNLGTPSVCRSRRGIEQRNPVHAVKL